MKKEAGEPVTASRVSEIRKKVRDQIAYHIKIDIDGDEQLFKEVWEEMFTDEEVEVAKAEMREIMRHLLMRGQS